MIQLLRGSLFLSAGFLSLICAVSGCRNEEIKSYVAEKETSAPVEKKASSEEASPQALPEEMQKAMPNDSLHQSVMAQAASAPAADPGIKWTAPKGWKEMPANSIRVGSFLIESEEGKKADISVIPLAGIAGGNLANVNRWRGQIGLPPISEEELAKGSEELETPAGRMVIIDIVSTETVIDNKYKARVIAAILPKGNTTWFFKMVGEDGLAASTKPAFKEFLNSVRLAS